MTDFYQQAVLMKPERLNTAFALLREHFERVRKESGCAFGEIEFDKPRAYAQGIQILVAKATLERPFLKCSHECSETELVLMEAMWATVH